MALSTTDFTSLGSIFVVIGAIFGAIGYAIVSFFRGKDEGVKNSEDAASESNSILRNLIEDQKLEIAKLRAIQETMQAKITDLQSQISELNARRSFLEGLISESVNSYFEAHPEMAQELAKSLIRTGQEKAIKSLKK